MRDPNHHGAIKAIYRWLVSCIMLTLSSCGSLRTTAISPALPTTAFAPMLTSVSPGSAYAGGAGFTLIVNGANFIPTSRVQWNGSGLPTSYVSSSQLTVGITPIEIVNAGIAAIAVLNPGSGGGTSSSAAFDVAIAPSIISLLPSSASAGTASFTLEVDGANFLPSSIITWNGSSHPTSYVNPTELTTTINTDDIATPGTATVTVVTPFSGGNAAQAPATSFTINGTSPSNVFFVSLSRNDSNPGTIEQPYLTIQRCAVAAPSGSICEVRAGTYRETITPNSGTTITSYDGESVTVDGSGPVTGWTLYQGSIYQAATTLSAEDTNQLFLDKEMMTEARWPNDDHLFTHNWATAEAGTTSTQIVDSNLPNINWKGATIHLWSGTDPYSNLTGTVSESGTGTLTIAVEVRYALICVRLPRLLLFVWRARGIGR